MVSLVFLLFWLGVAVVLYTYVGYGLVIYIFSQISKRPKVPEIKVDADLPEVTLLIAAYNEEGFIEDKIKNSLALDYPAEKLKIVFVTDGSTDQTPEIVKRYNLVSLFHEPQRKGKIHAVNRVMKLVTTPLVIFCDANTALNQQSIKNIVRHYQDSTVGGVAGEKRILTKSEDNASGAGEGLYWKYESFLKQKDSEVYSVVGAAGELFSIRTNLFEEPEAGTIIEDFYLSMRITAKGFRFVYEPDAYAVETASASVEEEWKRKVRISAGGFQSMQKLLYMLNIFKYGMLSFQYISHRVLRWTLAPLFLPIIFGTNLWLALQPLSFYQIILALQVLFYSIAFLGYLLRDKKVAIKGFFVPYYFVVMNASVYFGLIRYLRGKQSVVWEKSKRATA